MLAKQKDEVADINVPEDTKRLEEEIRCIQNLNLNEVVYEINNPEDEFKEIKKLFDLYSQDAKESELS